jgi:hypothetical protein
MLLYFNPSSVLYMRWSVQCDLEGTVMSHRTSVGHQPHCSKTDSMCTCIVVFVLSVHCKNIMSGIAGVLLQIMAQTCQKTKSSSKGHGMLFNVYSFWMQGAGLGTREKQAPYSGSCAKDDVYSCYVNLYIYIYICNFWYTIWLFTMDANVRQHNVYRKFRTLLNYNHSGHSYVYISLKKSTILICWLFTTTAVSFWFTSTL